MGTTPRCGLCAPELCTVTPRLPVSTLTACVTLWRRPSRLPVRPPPPGRELSTDLDRTSREDTPLNTSSDFPSELEFTLMPFSASLTVPTRELTPSTLESRKLFSSPKLPSEELSPPDALPNPRPRRDLLSSKSDSTNGSPPTLPSASSPWLLPSELESAPRLPTLSTSEPTTSESVRPELRLPVPSDKLSLLPSSPPTLREWTETVPSLPRSELPPRLPVRPLPRELLSSRPR